ncbi:DUF1768-domain-containing protein [Mycena chlorophos]|uniref:DUF1768-domain-containing protein n=1 Tax=Mycena chlorophos TaxID=658473 RepID=A0A8H6VQ76_MYCCL|nr:DUF1768-domain-containing protein [Mycena chlorophos]
MYTPNPQPCSNCINCSCGFARMSVMPVYAQPSASYATTQSTAAGLFTPPKPKTIFFFNRGEPYYEFTNFSLHSVTWEKHTYPTAEHVFQSHKFMGYQASHIRREIRKASSARDALGVARKYVSSVRGDWFDVNVQVMEQVIYLKFTQHEDLRRLLLSTGDAVLVEDSPYDAFWGRGSDGKGRNELGKALMRLRDSLRRGYGNVNGQQY